MSWTFPVVATSKATFQKDIEALRPSFEETIHAYNSAPKESLRQFERAIKAVRTLLVDDEAVAGERYTINLSGHANPDDAPASVTEFIAIQISGVPS